MTDVYIFALSVLWIAFFTYWFASAARAKKTVRRHRSYAALRVAFVVLILVLFHWVPWFRQLFSTVFRDPALNVMGLFVSALGMALAVWARVHLGRNWGMPMSLKEDPELVTSGPYRFVRHPIYTGFLLSMFGSAFVGGAVWFIILLFSGVYFVLAARAEERLMTEQFPDRYPEYKKGTKMLIPFVY